MIRSHKKSRTGCSQCKKRRVKCDERRPSCTNCTKNELSCSLVFLTPSNYSPRHSPNGNALAIHAHASKLYPEILPSDLEYQTDGFLSHFTLNVCVYVSDPERSVAWRNFITHLSLSHPFLLSGILALSALHLAIHRPEGIQRQRLQNFAVTKASAALPLYREALASPTLETIPPIFIFSGYLIPFTLLSSRDMDTCRLPKKSDKFPHWLYFLRGHRELVATYQADLINGPLASLFDSMTEPTIFESDDTADIYLLRLEGMFYHCSFSMTKPTITSFPISAVSSTLLNDDPRLKTCYTALSKLRAVTSPPGPYTAARSARTNIYTWLGDVNQEYLVLIEERFPQALLVFAGYCVLLASFDHIWFLKGLGSGLLKSIAGELESEWEVFMNWVLKDSDLVGRQDDEGEE